MRIILFALTLIALPVHADEETTTIYRDTFGVPHIYAPTVAAGLYAMGYAQAEDRPEQLLKNLLLAIGELASVAGPEAVPSDLRSRMFDHLGAAKRAFDDYPEQEQRRLVAFAAGVNAFYDAHPDDVASWWGDREVTTAMVDAFARFFLYNWSIDEAYGDLERGGIDAGFEPMRRASNQWAVSPARSASGDAILLIDPHLSWWGPSRFWEVRIHAGALNGSGVALAGSPYIGLGHNENLAWAMTTGGPDTADIYELTLNPENPDQYRYDGEWRDLTTREVKLAVAGEEPRTYELRFSHHGPIIAEQDGKAYAARIAYADVAGINRAWWELNFGEDVSAARRAGATLAMFPQNLMAADTSGNIYYQRVGRVPVRPDGYDWSRPVDGSTSATEWQGIHPASDHLEVLNPPQGYMQNCNVAPDAMMVDSVFDPADYKDYLFASAAYGPARSGWNSQRGARALELLSNDDSVTIEEALAYALDVRPYGVGRWQQLLEQVLDAKLLSGMNVALAREVIDWNGELRRDSAAALKYFYFRTALDERDPDLWQSVDDFFAIARGESPPPLALEREQLETLAESFAAGMERLAEERSLSDRWGDVFRVGRGDVSWPVGGGSGYALGLTSLRTVGYREPNEEFERWGYRGQTSTQVVVLSQPIQSWIYLPVGQSDRPDSPHYRDQAEKLFSPRRLKPSWWLREDLEGHIESTTVLEDAP